MATAVATAPTKDNKAVEPVKSDGVEELDEERPTRGRGAAPTVNYRKIFTDVDKCKMNPPSFEDGSLASDYRIYKITDSTNNTKLSYVWARSNDQALAFIAGELYLSEPLEAKSRGRAAAIDPVYCMYVENLVKTGNMNDVKAFLDEFEQYTNFATAKGYKAPAA